MGIDHDLPGLHQGRHARGVAGVFHKHQEGRGIRNEAPVQGDAVGHRGHAKFAHAVVDIVARRIVFNRCRARPDGQVTRRKIRRTAQQFREMRAVGVQRVLRGLAAGDFRRLGLQFRHVVAGGRGKVFRQGAIHAASQLSGQLRKLLLVGGEFLVPGVLGFFAARTRIPALIDLFRDLEGRIFPAQLLAGQGHLFFAQRRAVRLFRPRFVGRTEADDGPTDNQRRLIFHRLRFRNGLFNGLRIVTINVTDHMPVIGAEAFGRIIGKPAFGFAVDGDAVVIVKTDQLTQSERTGQRTGLMGDPLHQTAIAHENPGVMVDNLMTGAVKLCRQGAFGDGHADGIRQPLAQRAGGGLHPGGIAMLRVARRF